MRMGRVAARRDEAAVTAAEAAGTRSAIGTAARAAVLHSSSCCRVSPWYPASAPYRDARASEC